MNVKLVLLNGEKIPISNFFSFIFSNLFRWLPEKGYGFLRRNSSGSDIFVHLRDLNDGLTSLEEGQTVEFNLNTNDKGEIAQNVTIRNEP